MNTVVLKKGIGLGGAIAVTVSWSLNHSVLWCVLHGICGWFYLIYYGIYLYHS